MKKNSIQRNILFGFLSWLTPIGLTVIATPFIVHGLGAADYGLLALILGFISWSFTFNIGRAVTKYVAEYQAVNNKEGIERVLSATLLLSFLIGICGFAILYLLSDVIVVQLLQIAASQQAMAITAFHLCALTLAVLMFSQVFSSALQAIGRFDLFSHVTTFISLLLVAGNLILIYLKFGVVELLFWNLLTTALGALLFYVVSKKLMPEIRFKLFYLSKESFRLVAVYSAGIVFYQILSNVIFLFERSFITRTFGTESVTYYAVPMSLAMYIHVFVSSLSLALMPLTSEVGSQANTERLLSIYTRATKYVSLIVVFISIALSVGSKAFLSLWLSAQFAEKAELILIFHILTFGLMAIGIVYWQLTEGLGFPARNAWLVFTWLVISLPLMIWLTPQFGLVGTAMARTVGILTTPIFILWAEKQTFGAPLWNFWQRTILTLILAGTTSGVLQHFLLEKLPLGWAGFVFATGISGLAFLAVLFGLKFFTIEERQWLRHFAARAVAAS